MKSIGSSPRGMNDKDLDEFYTRTGQLADFSPQVETMFIDFLGYLSTRSDFMVGRQHHPDTLLKYYSAWRKEWPKNKQQYEQDKQKHNRLYPEDEWVRALKKELE